MAENITKLSRTSDDGENITKLSRTSDVGEDITKLSRTSEDLSEAHSPSADESFSDSDSSSISKASKQTAFSHSTKKSSVRLRKKSDRSIKSSGRSLEPDDDSEFNFTSNIEPDEDISTVRTKSTTSRKSKLCPKKRTCCSVFLCVCKVTIILVIGIVLSLIGIGFFLPKLQFNCKLNELGPKLHSGIYGQDVAIKRTLESLISFCTGLTSHDPLTFVFWGPTGVGKTFFTTILADHFDAKTHVVPSEDFKATKYKDWYGNQDPNRPFVYAVDDVMTLDDMQNIATNVEKFSHPLILIITTSMESNLLNQSFIDWCANGKAEMDYVYAGQDPTWLIELKHLNPVVVPFLPLSRTNVKLCVEKTLKMLKMKYGKDDIEKIAGEFEYFSNDKRLFSKIGCKRVNDKIFSVLSP